MESEYVAGGVRLTSIVGPDANRVRLEYWPSGSLRSVKWPDNSQIDLHYEDPRLPNSLTGLTDEKQQRTSTFTYNASGFAVATERSGGVGKFLTEYSLSPRIETSETFDAGAGIVLRTKEWSSSATYETLLPNGQRTLSAAEKVAGQMRLVSQSQPAGSGCAASVSSQAFDANGNVSRRDDFNGTRSCYAHDQSRGVESARVEGLATATSCDQVILDSTALPLGSRKITTTWHPVWRLATQIAEPRKITTLVYNGRPDPVNSGASAACAPGTAKLPDDSPIVVLCKQVEQATTDSNGQFGLAAALEPGTVARIQNWTYNDKGQVLTAKDPLNNLTSYEYYTTTTADYTKGDLKKIKNAVNREKNYLKYNKHGQLLESTDLNEVVTVNTYDLRQRLLSSSVGGETTGYAYYPNGLLKRVTQPDTSWIEYEYDDAHRLTAIKDNTDNRIEYTLDNSGNRKEEKVTDPSNALRRTLMRSFDALGRMQGTTAGSTVPMQ